MHKTEERREERQCQGIAERVSGEECKHMLWNSRGGGWWDYVCVRISRGCAVPHMRVFGVIMIHEQQLRLSWRT
jgi:hypothetical protein